MNEIQPRSDALDLNLLRVFEAVYQERHLARAAATLALTPSAVSHALRRLRGQLGDPLFVRQGTSMAATPACLRDAPALFDQLARLRQVIQQWGQFEPKHTRQTFRIGMPEAVEMSLLPTLQASLLPRAPHASLASVAYDRTQLVPLLASGRLDIAIDVAMPMRDPIRHEALLESDFRIIARKGHPLRRAPTLKQYVRASHVTVSSRAEGMVIEEAALLRLGLQRPATLRCQTYVSAFAIVASSDHLLTAPELMSRAVPSAKALHRWRMPFRFPKMHLHLYWHAHNESDPANQWLRSVVLGVVGNRNKLEA